jgi:hypothetical protein
MGGVLREGTVKRRMRRMKRSSVGAVAFICLLLLASAAAAPPAANLASIEMLVVDERGVPVGDVPLLIEVSDGETFVLVTDETGRARADLKVKGNKPLDLTITALGGSSTDVSLMRGDDITATLTIGPCERGYEWAIID